MNFDCGPLDYISNLEFVSQDNDNEGKGKWTKVEHGKFLVAIQRHPKGSWNEIAHAIPTRTIRQIQMHAHKCRKNTLRRYSKTTWNQPNWSNRNVALSVATVPINNTESNGHDDKCNLLPSYPESMDFLIRVLDQIYDERKERVLSPAAN